MTLTKALQYFCFVLFSVLCVNGVYWLLNQRSDYLLGVAGLVITLYFWLSIQSKLFTKNPFKK
ncbi:hypothetical protein [Spirosoma fluviale]|uniref:Uncharacterized protein n=1 Tax=Spirosoma fluviale TaxID=1597977 RepID=A0A286GQK4_9BACT|nr:hypothetical protein [Spirosoma fluviale]SOD97841.1 hypothetical protein SAMN06269250_5939 [Spirosoma fluviale]